MMIKYNIKNKTERERKTFFYKISKQINKQNKK